MKLDKHEFEFLINAALDTGDKEYFEELCYKQEHGLFEEHEQEVVINKDERDMVVKEFERLAREVNGILIRQFNNAITVLRNESEDNVKGRYEVFSDTLSDALICSYLRYEDMINSKTLSLPAPKGEVENESFDSKGKRDGDGEASSETEEK